MAAVDDGDLLASNFAKLFDRQPTDADRLHLYRVRDALRLPAESAQWAQLLAFQYYLALYQEMPEKITASSDEMLARLETYKGTIEKVIQAEHLANRNLVTPELNGFLEKFGKLKTDIHTDAYDEIIQKIREANTEYFFEQLHKQSELERQKLAIETQRVAASQSSRVGLPGVGFGWIMGVLTGSTTVAAYVVSHQLGSFVLALSVVLTLGIIIAGIYFARKGVIS